MKDQANLKIAASSLFPLVTNPTLPSIFQFCGAAYTSARYSQTLAANGQPKGKRKEYNFDYMDMPQASVAAPSSGRLSPLDFSLPFHESFTLLLLFFPVSLYTTHKAGDNSNYTVNLNFKTPIKDGFGDGKKISSLEGVVEHGLFLGMATSVIIAGKTGVEVMTK